MSGEDPIAAAARAVGGVDEPGEDPGAQTGSDRGADLTADLEPDPEPESVVGRLMRPLEGSIQEDHLGEIWSPEEGGLNRVALVAKEAVGLEDKLPRVAHLAVGVAEWYVDGADQLELPALGSGSGSEDSDPWGTGGTVTVHE